MWGINFSKGHFSIRNGNIASNGEHFLKYIPNKGRIMCGNDGINVAFFDIGAEEIEKLTFMSEILR